ncbi:MAG: hypothetical protein WCD86_17045 [Ktedonobacteraceae bacterium]
MNERPKQQARWLRQLEQEEQATRRFQEKHAAAKELTALYQAWVDEEKQHPRSQRTESRVYKEVGRLSKEIFNGKTEHIAERFQQAVELAVASTLPKRKGTYLKTLAALRHLLNLHTAWANAEPRSTAEQQKMLHQLRRLLYEIAAGEIEQIAERFTNLAKATTPIDDSFPGEEPSEQAGL